VQYKPVKSPSYPDGTVLGVSPAVGTVLPVGATVTVTVAG
jgi:beta-lactam-binding protein with PASTA domain